MEPTPPSPRSGEPRSDATASDYPESERARAERGPSNLGTADPHDSSRPGPVLAYARTSSIATAEAPRSVWPRRLMLIIFVVFCMEVGIMLAVLPWKQVWTNNPLVLRHPDLRAFLGNNFVRGLFSGLGFVDLWIGFWEAVHYSEE